MFPRAEQGVLNVAFWTCTSILFERLQNRPRPGVSSRAPFGQHGSVNSRFYPLVAELHHLTLAVPFASLLLLPSFPLPGRGVYRNAGSFPTSCPSSHRE